MQVLTAIIKRFACAPIMDFRRSYLLPDRQELSALSAESSIHVSIWSDKDVLAYCRLAWGISAPVQNNPNIKSLLETGSEVVDLIDGYVVGDFRALGLYNLLAAFAVEAAGKAEKSHLVLSASSAQGLTPVMQTWPILRAGMLGINPYSDAPLDLFFVPVTPDRLALTQELKRDQLEKLRLQGFAFNEQWQISGLQQEACTEPASAPAGEIPSSAGG